MNISHGYTILVGIIIFSLTSCFKSNMKLEDGDLLFKQKIEDNYFSDAVVSATESIDKYKFSHVGIVFNKNNKCFVIEAISKGVSLTPLDDFISDTSIVISARLIDAYKEDIPKALANILKTVGKPYDQYYSASNDSFYCSELVQKFYLHNNEPIFPLIQMTFKDLKTGKFPEFWQEHFKSLNSPIPEGELGSNPGNLSQSDKIKILGVIN